MSVNSVSVDAWGSKSNGNDCWWSIASNQAGKGASTEKIGQIMEEIKTYNAEKDSDIVRQDDVLFEGEQVYIPLEYAMDEISTNIETATTAFTTAASTVSSTKTAMESAKSAMESAKASYTSRIGGDTGGSEDAAKAALEAAKKEYEAAVKEYNAKEKEYNKAQSDYKTQKGKLENLKKELESLKKEYENEKSEVEAEYSELQTSIDNIQGLIDEKEKELEKAETEAQQETTENSDTTTTADDFIGPMPQNNDDFIGPMPQNNKNTTSESTDLIEDMQKYIAGLDTSISDSEAIEKYDINGDGQVTINDVTEYSRQKTAQPAATAPNNSTTEATTQPSKPANNDSKASKNQNAEPKFAEIMKEDNADMAQVEQYLNSHSPDEIQEKLKKENITNDDWAAFLKDNNREDLLPKK